MSKDHIKDNRGDFCLRMREKRPKTRKPTIRKLSRIERTAFLISLIILSDLSMQFHLSFKGHKSLEYCCLVIHLTSVSTISYAESNGGIFVLIGRIKPEIRRSKKSIVRVRD